MEIRILDHENLMVMLGDGKDILHLPTNVSEIQIGEDPNARAMLRTSAWKPSEEELKALNEGGCITIGLVGSAFPPLVVGVDPRSGDPVPDDIAPRVEPFGADHGPN